MTGPAGSPYCPYCPTACGREGGTQYQREDFPRAKPGFAVFPFAPWGGFEGFIIRGAILTFTGALLPAGWDLVPFLTLTTCTEILHFVQNDTSGRKVLLSTVRILHRMRKSGEVRRCVGQE